MKDNQDKINRTIRLFRSLQDELIENVAKRLKTDNMNDYDKDKILKWQVEKMSEMHLLNADTVKSIAEFSGKSEKQIDDLIVNDGLVVDDDITKQLSQLTKPKPVPPVTAMLQSVVKDTVGDVANNVNSTLIPKNFGHSPVARIYENIVSKTTSQVLAGIKTPQQALTDTVNQWVDVGVPSGFKDSAGRLHSVASYGQMLIDNTAHNTYNNVRMQRMDEFDVVTCLMSAHAASREACAPIQGHVVNMKPESDPRYDRHYDSIYNHDYGKASGTMGVNCRHIFTPFIPGVSENHLENVPKPSEAIANGKLVAKQRYYERQIRATKQKLYNAHVLGDEDSASQLQSQLTQQRKVIRQYIDQHDVLHRDYKREKVYQTS